MSLRDCFWGAPRDDEFSIEPLNDDGTFREDIFSETLNTTYIPIALRAARKADPHAKLYINDYNIEGIGASASAAVDGGASWLGVNPLTSYVPQARNLQR